MELTYRSETKVLDEAALYSHLLASMSASAFSGKQALRELSTEDTSTSGTVRSWKVFILKNDKYVFKSLLA